LLDGFWNTLETTKIPSLIKYQVPSWIQGTLLGLCLFLVLINDAELKGQLNNAGQNIYQQDKHESSKPDIL
jgi:hypothetical protein